MKISQQFRVNQDVPVVWEAFQDIASVAQCLPGATLTAQKSDDTYAGVVAVKLGPMTPTFEGEATVTADPETRTGVIRGVGTDRRGGSRGEVVVTYRLSGGTAPGSTEVAIDADVTLSGAAAQFGRTSVLNDISGRLIAEFAGCLEAKLSATTPESRAAIRAGEVQGLSLLAAGAGAALRRGATRIPPALAAAVAAAVVIAAVVVLRRRRRPA